MITLLFEIIKNIKLIIRDLRSLSVLVLGPFSVILLIGYIFSNEVPHDIKIGIADEGLIFEEDVKETLLKNMSEFGEVKTYQNVEDCFFDLKRMRAHVCIKSVTPSVESADDPFASKIVQIYGDNSRPTLNPRIISEIRLILDFSSENISIQSTQTILESIQELLINLTSRREQISSFVGDLSEFEDLVRLKHNLLLNFRSTYLAVLSQYRTLLGSLETSTSDLQPLAQSISTQIDTLQALPAQINTWSTTYTENFQSLKNDIEFSVNRLTTLNQSGINSLEKFSVSTFEFLNNASFIQDTGLVTAVESSEKAAQELSSLNAAINDIDLDSPNLDSQLFAILEQTADISVYLSRQLETFSIDAQSIEQGFEITIAELRTTYNRLNQFEQVLDNEISNNEQILASLQSSSALIREIDASLASDLNQFATLSPSIAQNIIKPIEQETVNLIKLRSIEVFFSAIIVIVVTFITLLFSNIITLTEINSQAHFRSLIAPVRNELFIFGLIITNIILVLVQITILFGVGQYIFHVDVFSHLFDIYVYSALLITLYTFIGMSVAYIVKKEQISILVSTFMAVSFYLVSSIIWPLEFMPKFGTFLATYNPAGFSEISIKQLLLYDVDILSRDIIWVLIAYNVLGLFFVLYAGRRYVRKLQ